MEHVWRTIVLLLSLVLGGRTEKTRPSGRAFSGADIRPNAVLKRARLARRRLSKPVGAANRRRLAVQAARAASRRQAEASRRAAAAIRGRDIPRPRSMVSLPSAPAVWAAHKPATPPVEQVAATTTEAPTTAVAAKTRKAPKAGRVKFTPNGREKAVRNSRWAERSNWGSAPATPRRTPRPSVARSQWVGSLLQFAEGAAARQHALVAAKLAAANRRDRHYAVAVRAVEAWRGLQIVEAHLSSLHARLFGRAM